MNSKVKQFDEEEHIRTLILSLSLNSKHKILDIGCGFGRNLEMLQTMGMTGFGVDVNPSIVKTCVSNGFNAMTVEDFDKSVDCYDVMIMSHVIEHFLPERLLDFIDHYLYRLKPGGHLIIATPFPWPYFLVDFDHIRPYFPQSIDWMYCGDNLQAQYCSRHRLERLNVLIRRCPKTPAYGQKLYLEQCWPAWDKCYDLIMRILFKITFGIVGITNGWVGLYRYKGVRDDCKKAALES